MRTFSKVHFEQARQEWITGEFSGEWAPYRHAAALQGFIYPPEGTKWDGWDADEPSQRAVLIRAIRERPDLLMQTIKRSHSWSEVIGAMLRAANWDAEQAILEERSSRKDRMDSEPNMRQAAVSLAAIFKRIGES